MPRTNVDGHDFEPLMPIAAALLDEIAPGWQEDPHMRNTPGRWARWWREFTEYDAGNVGTVIDVWSLCAHHLLPFSSTVNIGYLADSQVLGLSKFARIAHEAAHKPTSQEQMCADIADRITEVAGTPDVAVTASGVHLCMAMRGIKTPATMTTSVARGKFRDQPETRAEWFALLP
jgi:GTP cyclohydrolase I